MTFMLFFTYHYSWVGWKGRSPHYLVISLSITIYILCGKISVLFLWIVFKYGSIKGGGDLGLFLWKFSVKLWPLEQGTFIPHGHHLNNFSRGPINDDIYQTWKLLAFWFQKRYLKQEGPKGPGSLTWGKGQRSH